MLERFTREARQTIVLATEEARSLGHDHVGTEHILLGLLRCHDPAAGRVLESLGLTAERVRAAVLRLVGEGERDGSGQMPFTPRAKVALELALRESPGNGHIEPRHLLLGVAGEGQGVGARILREADGDLEEIRGALQG